MIHLTPSQLIRLWSELEQAYYGDNKFGGDTAEIYAYTVMEYSPVLTHDGLENRKAECYAEAATALYNVLSLFAERRECSIWVDGRPFGPWVAGMRFDHRCHVKVQRAE